MKLRPQIGRHSPEGVDAVLMLAARLTLSQDRRGAVEGLAAVEELAVHRGGGADAQGVALPAPYGLATVKRGTLGVVQLGRAEEVGGQPRMPRTTGNSGAGAPGSTTVCSGRRSATAVRRRRG
ncbi:hypothetical protein GCM10023100_04550 [Actinocorallia cavernae]|uniref:Uncharacterized protein n=2 Tax=Actinomycetes TaxID=1760 RepID=A0ABP8S9V2_9ACTN